MSTFAKKEKGVHKKMTNENQVVLRKELINKVVNEFPKLKTLSGNIERSQGRERQRIEKNFAQIASLAVFRNLTPSEILELNKASKFEM